MRLATNNSHHPRTADRPGPYPRCAPTPPTSHCLLPTAYSPLPTAYRLLPTLHPGISLLEVLISMFVLLFGLMGVAAVFPVGNHYANQGDRYDRDVALIDTAFSELSARGMLQPDKWVYSYSYLESPNALEPVMAQVDDFSANPPMRKGNFRVPIPPLGAANNVPHPGFAFVIDPVGTAAGAEADAAEGVTRPYHWFPVYDANADAVNDAMPNEWQVAGGQPGLSGNGWPVRRVTLDIDPRPGNPTNGVFNVTPMNRSLADLVFRLRDDLTVDLPREDDRPAVQPLVMDDNGTPSNPADDIPLARAYRGAYSWLAMVVPTTADNLADSTDALEALQPAHPGYGHKHYDVSVVVFHRRETPPSAQTERSVMAELQPGGQLILYGRGAGNVSGDIQIDQAVDGLRPGHWIAVAGVLPQTVRNGAVTPAQLLIRWYRILAMDDETHDTTDNDTKIIIHDPNGGIQSGAFARRLMLDGPDWPNVAGKDHIPSLRAFILPGVISVSTRTVKMETPSAWTVQRYPSPGGAAY